MLDGDKTGLKSNERLEFLGDVVLDMTMAHYLYRNFPEAQEGELTKRKPHRQPQEPQFAGQENGPAPPHQGQNAP